MKSQIDELFTSFTSDGRLAAVSAAVCNSDGVIYQGAFGKRAPDGPDMTFDTVGSIMSMTKAITGAAAMHCVESGLLDLNAPAGDICPYLGEVRVLDGFDSNDDPILRPPVRPVTLKNLLTHSSGFVYDIWNRDFVKACQKLDIPSIMTMQKRALEVPLMFDPDSRWEYGIGIDWAGQMVEAVSGLTLGEYFKEHITGPLGMDETAFNPTEAMQAKRMAMMMRTEDGQLVQPPAAESEGEAPPPEFEMGGGGLISSAKDYIRFLQMILRDGELDGTRILKEETIDLMGQNHMGDLRVTELPANVPEMSLAAEFFPGDEKTWGLTFQINEEPGHTGRSKGTLMWAGLTNCYFWIDRDKDVAGVFVSQSLPFADPICLDAYYKFETLAYDHLQ